jgi:hypothetical protein
VVSVADESLDDVTFRHQPEARYPVIEGSAGWFEGQLVMAE